MPQETLFHNYEIPVPYDISSEDTDVWGDILNKTFRRLDEEVILRGDGTDKPFARQDGRLYLDTTSRRIEYDTGNAWSYLGIQGEFKDSDTFVTETPWEINFTNDISLTKAGTGRIEVSVDDSFVRNTGDAMTGSLTIDGPDTAGTFKTSNSWVAFDFQANSGSTYTRFEINDGNHKFSIKDQNSGNHLLKVLPSNDIDVTLGNLHLGVDLLATDGEILWDESAGHIPQARLEQGDGSTLDADTLDGVHLANIDWANTALDQSEVNVSDLGTADAHLDMSGYNVSSVGILNVSEFNSNNGNDPVIVGQPLEYQDDVSLFFGNNKDFNTYYESSTDELVLADANGVELIRQPKGAPTQFLQGADIGSIEAPEDSLTQIINAAVTSSLASGDRVGYSFAVDAVNALTIDADADGSGGIQSIEHRFSDSAGGRKLVLRESKEADFFGRIDTNGNSIKDSNATQTIWDAAGPHVPLAALEQNAVTVTAGNQLTGGGTVTLGGSITIDLNEGGGSGLNADTVDGAHKSDLDSQYVDAAGDTMSGNLTLGGDLIAADGEILWDESAGYIPEAQLQHNSVTVNSGNALTGGATLTLNDSTTLDVDETAINHGNLAGLTGTDHHTQYMHVDARRGFTNPVEGIDPDKQTHLATKDYVDSVAQGLEYKESIIAERDTPPGSPSSGDRYLVEPATFAITAVDTTNNVFTVSGDQSTRFDAGESFEVIGSTGNDSTYSVSSVAYDSTNDVTDITTNESIGDSTADGSIHHADGAWNGNNESLTEYDGSSWSFNAPNEGWSVFIESPDEMKTFNGVDWVTFGSTIKHDTLQGLGHDDHTQYLHRDGRRAMNGTFDVDGNDIADGTAGVTVWDAANAHVPSSNVQYSGLDADTVDSYEAADFAARAENETITGAWEFGSSGDRVAIDGDSIYNPADSKEINFGGGLISFYGGYDFRGGGRVHDDNEWDFGSDRDFRLEYRSGSTTFVIEDLASGQGNVLEFPQGGAPTFPNGATVNGAATVSDFLDLQPITEPAAPSTGKRVFVDSADGGLKVKDSSGNVVTIAE